MTVQSMTGFARAEGMAAGCRFVWELRSVNGKGLDIRLRLPSGYEGLESAVRTRLSHHLARGNLQVSLSLSMSENRVEAVINEDALAAVLALRTRLGPEVIATGPMSLDSFLSIRGLVEFREAEEGPDIISERNAALLDGLDLAAKSLVAMRQTEGQALKTVLLGHVETIERLARTVEADPSRQPEEIARKLAGQIAALIQTGASLDRERLHAEAALLATKADLREEIDRLIAHGQAARDLLSVGGPVGRKLDFLAQEFNRESNTICSKSNSAAVTAAGIELKVVIDQFREQVQNLE
ncbi:YicC family protein [Allorhizobium sp. BGMRC 0089]|uniref:YicC/YloC family endoribonuclease n=1 Tax=Allorhizobium sonneratiae TaxID=2934936 RepID=UPI0020348467|nr:YicC/YloC family endoribonuclease [Allorhizobium sonneratiae]MCM2292055.1 YicC family protein [Allorhizobium sonneratiae]